jgi:hypothetical protein
MPKRFWQGLSNIDEKIYEIKVLTLKHGLASPSLSK